MTDLLSPSPYAYLDGLSPSERQAEIYRRQHRDNGDTGSVIDTARRARDLQAEVEITHASLENMVGLNADNCTKLIGAEEDLDAYRTMCAELVEAASVFAATVEVPEWISDDEEDDPIFKVRDLRRFSAALTKARKLMEGKE